MLEPLSCGLYFNTVFGSEFWDREPERYPDNYYPLLKTKVRTNIFIGQRMTKIIPANRRKFLKSIRCFMRLVRATSTSVQHSWTARFRWATSFDCR